MQRSNEKGIPQTNRETCYFCGSEGPIESHHVIPRRLDGGDGPSNLVDLCPTCHERLERLYDDQFYAALGVGSTEKQLELIHESVSQDIEDTAEDLFDDLSRLSKKITDKYVRGDVEETAWEVYQEKRQQDRGNGKRKSKQQIEDINIIIDVVEEYGGHTANQVGHGAPMEKVFPIVQGRTGLEKGEITHKIENLKQKGELYEPEAGYLRST